MGVFSFMRADSIQHTIHKHNPPRPRFWSSAPMTTSYRITVVVLLCSTALSAVSAHGPQRAQTSQSAVRQQIKVTDFILINQTALDTLCTTFLATDGPSIFTAAPYTNPWWVGLTCPDNDLLDPITSHSVWLFYLMTLGENFVYDPNLSLDVFAQFQAHLSAYSSTDYPLTMEWNGSPMYKPPNMDSTCQPYPHCALLSIQTVVYNTKRAYDYAYGLTTGAWTAATAAGV